jgi:hypothetical protein
MMFAAGACALTHALPSMAQIATNVPVLLGAWRKDGCDYAGVWDSHAGPRGVELPFRAHEVLTHPSRAEAAFVIARRPGEFLARLNVHTCSLEALTTIEPEFVASGHAVFASDGRTLLVAESDAMSGGGYVACYDPDSLQCYARYPTGGIGPHAILRVTPGTYLIANGGVLTIAQSGRTKLNGNNIESSLVRMADDGRLLGQWRLTDSYLSIRHLAQSRDGYTGLALQAEHPSNTDRESAPVFAVFDGRSIICAEASSGFGGYAGDIACIETPTGPVFALGCTRANAVGIWDKNGELVMRAPLRSACAVLGLDQSVIAPSESGELALLAPAMRRYLHRSNIPHWDNHAQVWPGRLN